MLDGACSRNIFRNNYDVACPMNFRKYPYDTQICKVKYESCKLIDRRDYTLYIIHSKLLFGHSRGIAKQTTSLLIIIQELVWDGGPDYFLPNPIVALGGSWAGPVLCKCKEEDQRNFLFKIQIYVICSPNTLRKKK